VCREDNKIKDLSFLVGPKLYEANWMDLTKDQYLARAQCVEVWCPMTKEFYAEYIRCGFNSITHRTQKLMYVMNPTKFRVCEYLVRFHAQRGDKIIIFSDDLPALFYYCELLTGGSLAVPVVCGATTEERRKQILQTFKTDNRMTVIGLSSVGDTALDIPEANVVIQVSSHFGARRQEAQVMPDSFNPLV
jgi:DNA excision repair protein ERCC-3